MKELNSNNLTQKRTLFKYLSAANLLKNKDIFMCLNFIEKE